MRRLSHYRTRPPAVPLVDWLYELARRRTSRSGDNGLPGTNKHARYLARVSVRFHALLKEHGIHVEGAS